MEKSNDTKTPRMKKCKKEEKCNCTEDNSVFQDRISYEVYNSRFEWLCDNELKNQECGSIVFTSISVIWFIISIGLYLYFKDSVSYLSFFTSTLVLYLHILENKISIKSWEFELDSWTDFYLFQDKMEKQEKNKYNPYAIAVNWIALITLSFSMICQLINLGFIRFN